MSAFVCERPWSQTSYLKLLASLPCCVPRTFLPRLLYNRSRGWQLNGHRMDRGLKKPPPFKQIQTLSPGRRGVPGLRTGRLCPIEALDDLRERRYRPSKDISAVDEQGRFVCSLQKSGESRSSSAALHAQLMFARFQFQPPLWRRGGMPGLAGDGCTSMYIAPHTTSTAGLAGQRGLLSRGRCRLSWHACFAC